MARGLKNLSYEESLMELDFFTREKKRLRKGSSLYHSS